jgi:hypothetical protein
MDSRLFRLYGVLPGPYVKVSFLEPIPTAIPVPDMESAMTLS